MTNRATAGNHRGNTYYKETYDLMKAGAITVTFSLIVFLSVMSFLAAKTDNKDPSTYKASYSSDVLHTKLSADAGSVKPYYELGWKERLEFEKSVWGFDWRDMLILAVLFGVFLGSLKMAAVYREKL